MRITSLFLFFITTISLAQTLLLEENFDYTAGTNLTDKGWTAHSSSGTNPIKVTSSGLSYYGYPPSGIGNAALLNNNGEDVNRIFTAQTSGTVYYSFLVKVDAVSEGYFIHLINSGTNFAARVFIKSATSGFNFGVSNSNTSTYGTNVYTIGTTYLCIVEYIFSTSTVNLWVKSSGVPSSKTEAGGVEATASGSGQTSLSAIALRQYSSTQNITVDGIRVSNSWDMAPLPVQLTSFIASLNKNNVLLYWQTATEVNNYGFEIERKSNHNDNWEKIGFVQGNGNSNSPKEYSFIDQNPSPGKIQYRLKQIDFDGSFEYSNIEEVNFIAPQEFSLQQNYPNPFNPETIINYKLPKESNVKLTLFDIMGREIAVLVNEKQNAGSYNYKLSTNKLKLSSGTYFYKLQADNFSQTKKLIIMK